MPVSERYHSMLVRLPTPLYEAAKAVAEAQDRPMAWMIREAVKFYVAGASAATTVVSTPSDSGGVPVAAPSSDRTCPHPRDKRRNLGYVTICGVCEAKLT